MVRTLRRLAAGFTVAVTTVLVFATPANAASSPPDSIASLGDSITRAFNACGWYSDCPSRSWSTGGSWYVYSHYQRIFSVNWDIYGNNYNDARSGAKADDLPGQAATAVGQGAEYVTILIGANDACTSSESTMTPVSTYRSHINSALAKLKNGLPNARILIVSIPDIYRLWYVGHTNDDAVWTWNAFGICQSMLDNPRSTSQADEDRRQRVRQRVIDFNTQLARACTAYGSNCKFDGNAVFNYPFQLSHVSEWDYFHPNTNGQDVLARVTYQAGYNW